MTPPIGLLGGTFDPVHFGHLRFAAEVLATLRFAEMRLVPAGSPPHREGPRASAADRLAMVRLGVAAYPGLTVDDREVRRASPSYTVLTLAEIRAERPGVPLAWLLGADAFCGLPTWHRWRDLFGLAHFVVTARPGFDLEAVLPPELRDDWLRRRVADARALSSSPAGSILVHAVTPQDVSASDIRRRLAAGEDVSGLLPSSVLEYIASHHLYPPARCA